MGEEPKRLSPEWVAAKLNSIEGKLDQLLAVKTRVPAKRPETKPVPKPKERVIYDATSDRYYSVPIEGEQD